MKNIDNSKNKSHTRNINRVNCQRVVQIQLTVTASLQCIPVTWKHPVVTISNTNTDAVKKPALTRLLMIMTNDNLCHVHQINCINFEDIDLNMIHKPVSTFAVQASQQHLRSITVFAYLLLAAETVKKLAP